MGKGEYNDSRDRDTHFHTSPRPIRERRAGRGKRVRESKGDYTPYSNSEGRIAVRQSKGDYTPNSNREGRIVVRQSKGDYTLYSKGERRIS